MGGGESQNLRRDWCGFIMYLMTQQCVSPVGIGIQEGKWKSLSMYVVNWMLYTVQVVKEALQFL
jgi:hypothetical protein